MADRIVINTGPIITFARIDVLDRVGGLPYEFICPTEVRAELDEGESAGYPRLAPPWLKTKQLKGTLSPIILTNLDRGEAAVIQLALEQGIERVCIDEWKGRRVALGAGLKVTGVLGLLAKAKKLGIIQTMGPYVERAIQEGIHYHPELVREILKLVGE